MTSTNSDPYFYTWTAQRHAGPQDLVGGDGVRVRMGDGSEWLDLGSLSYQANAGHGHRKIIEAVVAQAQSLCLVTPNTEFPAKRALASKLLELAGPEYDRVFFALGGAEANENAIKIARQFTGRYKLVSRYRSYHGATMGAISLTGDWRRIPAEPGLPGVIHAMDCYCERCPFGQQRASCKVECAQHIDQLMTLEGMGTVAAVILEPVPGANGVLVPHDDYWAKVARACAEHGALLIADEVLTGFGRTGRVFGHQRWGVTPDLITVAKALTGGYAPLSAVIVHRRVSRHFDDVVLACGLTNYAHPLGCAAGVAALQAYEAEGMYDNAAQLEPQFLAGLRAVAARLPGQRAWVRGVGLMGCLELEAPAEHWQRFAQACRAQRILLHADAKRQTIIVTPPLCITAQELAEGLTRLEHAVVAGFAQP